MFSTGKWGYTTRKEFMEELGVMKEFWQKPFQFSKSKTSDRKKKNEKFIKFNGYKFFDSDFKCWVGEEKFFERYGRRRPLTREDLYKRYMEKFRTVLNWFCVSYNGKEMFWQNIKRDFENDKLDCYKVRPEEIINTCTSTTRKYCRTQRNVDARRKRTQLFESKLFKDRYSSFKKTGRFIGKDDKFNNVVLAELRKEIQMGLGYRFINIEFEEKVLHAMASNCDMFGSGIFRYNEKQLYNLF
jgi:hypothetical protein